MAGWNQRLDYDNTDADTLAASDFVGARILSGDAGTEITSTTIASDVGLDVNVINDLSIAADGVYDGGTNTDPDNVGLIAHVRAASPADINQTFRSTGASPAADDVDPANVHALDANSFLMLWDGTAFDRATKDATSGGMDVHLAGSDIALDVDDTANTAIANGATVIGTTAADAVASPLANRKYLYLMNNSAKQMYIGSTGVTTANGFPLGKANAVMLRAGAAIDIEAIGADVGLDMRYLELS